MKNKEERLEKISKEDFYLIYLDGTFMPNNRNYTKVTMFEDVFYVENENEEKKYDDKSVILEVKQMIENRKNDIEKILANNASSIKNSYTCKLLLKINKKEYNLNRNICNNAGKKIFNEIVTELYKILFKK